MYYNNSSNILQNTEDVNFKKESPMTKDDFIKKYNMIPHREGGFYAETRQPDNSGVSHIFYLLPQGETAAWHRLHSEELWLFHHGGELRLILGGNGDTPVFQKETRLNGENLRCLIPSDTWQKATALGGDVLVSCVARPAFQWHQWELYQKEHEE